MRYTFLCLYRRRVRVPHFRPPVFVPLYPSILHQLCQTDQGCYYYYFWRPLSLTIVETINNNNKSPPLPQSFTPTMMKKTIKSKTGFRGVCKNGERGYKAQITIAGKSKNLGTFTTMEQGEQLLAWSLCCWVFCFVLFSHAGVRIRWCFLLPEKGGGLANNVLAHRFFLFFVFVCSCLN